MAVSHWGPFCGHPVVTRILLFGADTFFVVGLFTQFRAPFGRDWVHIRAEITFGVGE